MKWLFPALAALWAGLALNPASAQPTAPPLGAATHVYSYCWNGTAMVVCGQPVIGTYANGGVALSTTTAQIFAANAARVRIKLLNNSGIGTAGGVAIVIWCRWGTVAGAPAVPGGVGSFALQPNGGGIDDQGPGINQSALNCLAESGTPTLYAEQY
jgi:hypothetical protein